MATLAVTVEELLRCLRERGYVGIFDSSDPICKAMAEVERALSQGKHPAGKRNSRHAAT